MPLITQAPNDPFKENKPSSIEETKRLAKLNAYRKRIKKKKIALDDLAQFCEQLAAMLEAGLPLVVCLEALKEQTNDPVFALIVAELKTDVGGGTTFSDAMRKFPNAFPGFIVSMVEAGEASGALGELMEKIAEYLVGSSRLAKKVKSALTYPMVVIAMAIILVNVLLIFVIPVFAEMFTSFGAKLPLPTRILIETSHFLNHYIIYFLVLMAIGWRFLSKYLQTRPGRVMKDTFFSKIPVIGTFLQKIAIARFTRTYATLIRAGVPIIKSIDICGAVSNNVFIEDTCANISRHVTQGGQISEILQNDKYFPKLVTHMTRAGEQSGAVDKMMDKVANFYDVEVEKTVTSLTSLIEPFLIVTVGLVVGGIVTAMFMPIVQLSSIVGQ